MLPTALTIRHRTIPVLAVLALTAGLLLATPGRPAQATHVSANDTSYGICDRVFPDPHAYWPTPAPPGQSPFAKGNGVPPTCKASAFITYQEMIDGVEYLESQFPEFIEFYRLEDLPPHGFGTDTDCAASNDQENYCSAGLPQTGGTRQREELYMIRVTDERSATDSPGNLPMDDKKLFAFPLSIHGIERAGVEGGTRAAEDLATWAYCEAANNGETVHEPSAMPEAPNCDQEGFPHPLLEAQSDTPVPGENLSAGQALKQSATYFIYSNPDGWRRGEGLPGFYQRYNGNGVDLNRDWPNIGFTFKPYTPWSEPETKGFGEVLQDIRPQWDGGIDLHGQLVDRAFSFTLLGALPNGDFSQNQRILQTVRGAWADAEGRLGWSPHIKPNDAPPQPDDPRMYGVQWGTVWDTIDYTVTGAHGDWIASPIGLGADGIDNEMSFSHLANCGTGTCYEPVFEQMHIDGNKSLIYAMVNYSLLPEDDHFEAPGKVAYVTDDTRVVNSGTLDPGTEPPDLPTQDDILNQSLSAPNFIHEFDVQGPDSTPPVYNGGLVGTATPSINLNGIGPASVVSLVLERYRPVEENPDIPTEDAGCAGADDRWEEVNRYYNQSSIYLQAGEAVHTNSPTPGRWRICVTGDVLTNFAASGGSFDLDIVFTEEEAFHLPPGGQAPYDVSNMDFFQDLKPNMDPGQLIGVSADSILSGETDLNDYTSLVIADDPFPGYSEISAAPSGPAQDPPPGSPYGSPGVGTAPCAYQRGDTDVPPGSNNPPPGCANTFEFDVDPAFNNQQLIVKLTSTNPGANDWDLFVDRQGEDGGWSEAGRSTTPTGNETVTVFTPPPGHYRALVVNWSSADASSAQTLDISFSDQYVGPPIVPSTRSQADLATWGGMLKAFVEGGGNLVLTDGAIKNLAYMGTVPREKVESFSVYAGYIGFTADGGDTSTYADPLAKDVNQPGAAEGPGHRHQIYEPVPIGYAIQDEGGSDLNSGPVWSVDQETWEGAGGRTAGTTTDEKVTLGELPVGNGVVRIIGPLLPMPTEQFYHPFGLASYALTYSGYQVFNNALQWNRTTAAGGAGTGTAGGGVFIPKDCSRLKKLSGYNIVIGTTGKDKIKGTPGKDGLCGRAGKDVIRGLGGKDVLIGGKHRDKLAGGAGNDRIFAGKGNDLLKGGGGKDLLVGHQGRDRLIGGGGRNVLRGGGGQDFCRGGSGKDKYQGCEQQA